MKNLEKLYNECVNELNSIGIILRDIGEIDINISKRNNKRYGCCKQEEPDTLSKVIIKSRGKRIIQYEKFNKHHIEISPWVMELDDIIIKNTIIHEIIHCFPKCGNHKEEFKKYAKYINMKLGYNISRVGNKEEDFKKSNIQFVDKRVYKYEIKCKCCGQTFYRIRCNKNFSNKYRCGKCRRSV